MTWKDSNEVIHATVEYPLNSEWRCLLCMAPGAGFVRTFRCINEEVSCMSCLGRIE